MKDKKMTVGKKLGLVSFVISEILVILVVLAVMVNIFFEMKIDAGLIVNVLFFQGSIFGIVWGSKASSNFAKKKETNFAKKMETNPFERRR